MSTAVAAAAGDREIATAILAQISPGVRMRLGARNPRYFKSGVQFTVGKGRKRSVIIELEPSDTYRVEYGRIASYDKGSEWVTISEHKGVYVEQLDELLARL